MRAMSVSLPSSTTKDHQPRPTYSMAIGTEQSLSGSRKSDRHVSLASNIIYDEVDIEPRVNARTYIAFAAMLLLNFTKTFGLQGPPAVLSYIGKELNSPKTQTWIPNSLSLVQAVISPLVALTSDAFQARKVLLIGSTLLALIGSAIAPGSSNIYRLVIAQTLIGFGASTVALAYCVPSEILPRKWRPMAQAGTGAASSLGSVTGPLVIGALTRERPLEGWRTFYWIQMGMWALTAVALLVGYNPPKRHTSFDNLSLAHKINHLDLPGCGLFTTGLTLFLTGLNLGSNLYNWTNVRTLLTLILGIVTLVAFGVYEWNGTQTGIFHHDLFRGGRAAVQTFTVCIALFFIEGILLFSWVIFFPILTRALFESDPLMVVVRGMPFWLVSMVTGLIYGFASTRLKTIRLPLLLGFLVFTAGIVGYATIQPSQSTNSIVFAGVASAGLGAPLVLILTGVQLSVPHHLIATSTAITTSSRATGVTIFTSIFVNAFNNRLQKRLPAYVSKAVLSVGLPGSSLGAFLGALSSGERTEMLNVPGVDLNIVAAGLSAQRQAYADSIRLVYIIASAFGILACLLCLLLGEVRSQMDYRVDAPVEVLHPKAHRRIPADI